MALKLLMMLQMILFGYTVKKFKQTKLGHGISHFMVESI